MSGRALSKSNHNSPVNTEDLRGLIAAFAPYLRVAHHIPGRIRLKIDLAVLDEPSIRAVGTDALADALGVIRGVHAITLNKLARSCTIEYDRVTIPDAAWPDLLAGHTSPAAGVLIDIIEQKYMEVGRGEL